MAEEVVGQGLQEHGVETVILLGEGLARGGELLHLLDDGVDRAVPGREIGRASCRERV